MKEEWIFINNMEAKQKSEMSKRRLATSVALSVIELAYILGISTVLILNDGDCETPLRLWLQVLLIAFLVHFFLLTTTEIFMPYCSKFLSGKICAVSASFNGLLSVFMVVWFVFGNYWYYNADNKKCVESFYEGELAVFSILLIYYLFLGSACCLGCLLFILISLGSGITNRAADY